MKIILKSRLITLAIVLVQLSAPLVPASRAQSGMMSLTNEDCKISTRRKFTSRWSNFADTFKNGTRVKVLGPSMLGKVKAIIFDVQGTPGIAYKMFEFKAPRSCFSGSDGEAVASDDSGEDAFGDAVESAPDSSSSSSYSASSKVVYWRAKGLYFSEKFYFKDTAARRFDKINGTNMGLAAGLAMESPWGRNRIGAAALIVFTSTKAKAADATVNTFDASAMSFGIELEPYFMHPVSRKISIGGGVSVISHYTMWDSTAIGAIDSKLSTNTTFKFKSEYALSKSKIGLDVGFGMPFPGLMFAAHYDF